MKKFMLGVVVYMMTMTVWAAGSGLVGPATIKTMYVNGGWTQVRAPELDASNHPGEEAAYNPSGCEKTYYFAIHPTDDNYAAIHSTLLSAQMTGKKVSFWLDGCGGQDGAYPRIRSVWLFTD
ncbi:hypothetical protein [Microbulbifer sp. GL-2]|uniref:hypothetical protein n=1 Tax=unclassified Microbulbifer TaxID=2619833 RepID=UPI0011637A51|nr:hypothetical protein [Microbulbifer sp. GL-2]BBM03929.1 hypothetical protein GL2_40030 [Microbulbifer sp. GL-2]